MVRPDRKFRGEAASMAINVTKRTSTAVSFAAGLSLVLAACSGGGNGNDAGDGDVSDGTAGGGSVSVLVVWGGEELKRFEAAGYEVPEDWDGLNSLVDEAAAAGTTPWGISLESGAASGWPATDWIEDFVIRQSGPEVYDAWVNGEQAWSSDEIRSAWESFGKWATDPAYVSGGPNTVLTLPFGNGGDCLFSEPAGCLLHHQASFITSFFEENSPGVAEAGTTYDFFPMPAIDFDGVVYGGDLFGMFNDTPQAQALMEYP